MSLGSQPPRLIPAERPSGESEELVLSDKSPVRRKQVRLSDVAAELNVSPATVSNAFNHPDQLSESLRRKVLDTAEKIGYLGPNPAARALVRRKFDSIGLVLSERFAYSFHSRSGIEVLRGVVTACDQAGMSLTLLPLRDDTGTCALLNSAAIDSVGIFGLPDGTPVVSQSLQRGLPLITLDQPYVEGVPFIGIDDRNAAKSAAEYAISLTHKRFGVIALPTGPRGSGSILGRVTPDEIAYRVPRERLHGYLETIKRHNLPDPVVFIAGSPSEDAGAVAAGAILSSSEQRPTCLLCMSDELATGAERAAMSAGLRIPEDISIIGFDGFPEATPAPVALTTVSQNSYERGLLMGTWLTRPNLAVGSRIQPTQLTIRDSCDVPTAP